MRKAEIFHVLRMTTSFDQDAKLKPNILPERALKRLHEYESTQLTPCEILRMKETIINLQKRLKKLEEW